MEWALRRAREFEEQKKKEIDHKIRPAFHLSPCVGWMNDPNGFSYYNGRYHLFYQYHPYDAHWGPMHWGHAVSDDLLHWEYLPTALAPDQLYDRDGCFSGSALTLPDGRHLLMYTGVVKAPNEKQLPLLWQVQCLAVGDGVNYEKYEHNPVITKSDLPPDASPYDFRDPKIWREADGTYRCVIGSRCLKDNTGQILMYASDDAKSWRFVSVLDKNDSYLGRMWECPDFFVLDGKHVLLISPQEMTAINYSYDSGNNTAFLWGSYDEKNGKLLREADQPADYGIDFYAPQTILTEDGRRIMIAWMQEWEASKFHPSSSPLFGQMTLPRELYFKNGRIYQQPIREIETLRRSTEEIHLNEFKGTYQSPEIKGRFFDMEISLKQKPEKGIADETGAPSSYRCFDLHLAENKKYHTLLRYTPYDQLLRMSRRYAGSRLKVVHEKACLADCPEGELKLRVILDHSGAEVFVQEGEKVMSMMLPTPLEADGISFHIDGQAELDIKFHDLSPAE